MQQVADDRDRTAPLGIVFDAARIDLSWRAVVEARLFASLAREALDPDGGEDAPRPGSRRADARAPRSPGLVGRRRRRRSRRGPGHRPGGHRGAAPEPPARLHRPAHAPPRAPAHRASARRDAGGQRRDAAHDRARAAGRRRVERRRRRRVRRAGAGRGRPVRRPAHGLSRRRRLRGAARTVRGPDARPPPGRAGRLPPAPGQRRPAADLRLGERALRLLPARRRDGRLRPQRRASSPPRERRPALRAPGPHVARGLDVERRAGGGPRARERGRARAVGLAQPLPRVGGEPQDLPVPGELSRAGAARRPQSAVRRGRRGAAPAGDDRGQRDRGLQPLPGRARRADGPPRRRRVPRAQQGLRRRHAHRRRHQLRPAPSTTTGRSAICARSSTRRRRRGRSSARGGR